MKVEITIPDVDLEIIKLHLSFIQEMFPRFNIVSDAFMIDNDPTAEWVGSADEFYFKEAVFEIDSNNNLWALAKAIQNYKLTGELKF